MATSYCVIESPLGSEDADFFQAFHRMLEQLSVGGAPLELSDRRESSSQIRLTYADDENKLTISIWDDYVSDLRYLEITSADENLHDRALKLIERNLRVAKNSDILKRAAMERALAVLR